MGLFRRRGPPQGTALLDEDTGDLVVPLTPEGEADDGAPGPLPEKMGLGDEEVAEDATTALFSESTTRFLVEVRPADLERLRAVLGDHAVHDLGEVTEAPLLEVSAPDGEPLIALDVADLRAAFHGSFAG